MPTKPACPNDNSPVRPVKRLTLNTATLKISAVITMLIQNVLNVSGKPAKITTAAISKMVGILELRIPAGLDHRLQLSARIPESKRPVVFVGPYEHHSNELPWRESIADVVPIGEDRDGHIDVADLREQLIRFADRGSPHKLARRPIMKVRPMGLWTL